jgi:hypothetical protein
MVTSQRLDTVEVSGADLLLVVGDVDDAFGGLLSALGRVHVSQALRNEMATQRPTRESVRRTIARISGARPSVAYAAELVRRLDRLSRGLT